MPSCDMPVPSLAHPSGADRNIGMHLVHIPRYVAPPRSSDDRSVPAPARDCVSRAFHNGGSLGPVALALLQAILSGFETGLTTRERLSSAIENRHLGCLF